MSWQLWEHATLWEEVEKFLIYGFEEIVTKWRSKCEYQLTNKFELNNIWLLINRRSVVIWLSNVCSTIVIRLLYDCRTTVVWLFCVWCATIVRQSYDNRTTIVRQSYNNRTTIVRQSYDNRMTFVRQSYDNRTTIIRQSYDNRTTIVRQSYDNRTTIVRQSYDNRTTIVRQSYDNRTTIVRQSYDNRPPSCDCDNTFSCIDRNSNCCCICWQASDNFVSIVNNVMYVDDQILIEAQESRQAPIKWVDMFGIFEKIPGFLGSGNLRICLGIPECTLNSFHPTSNISQLLFFSPLNCILVSLRRPSMFSFISINFFNQSTLFIKYDKITWFRNHTVKLDSMTYLIVCLLNLRKHGNCSSWEYKQTNYIFVIWNWCWTKLDIATSWKTKTKFFHFLTWEPVEKNLTPLVFSNFLRNPPKIFRRK